MLITLELWERKKEPTRFILLLSVYKFKIKKKFLAIFWDFYCIITVFYGGKSINPTYA